jgi:hypothetical protein
MRSRRLENRKTLRAYVTSLEYDYIKNVAGQAKISISKFVRQVCLGSEPRCEVDREAVLALLRVNQDLSRLGNLFKLAVNQGALDESQAREIIASITEAKKELMEKARAIYDPEAH